MIHRRILIIALASLLCLQATAQETDKSDKLSFRIGSFYTSRLHYYGRTDSLKSSGFFPLAELQAGKYFYLSAAPVFVMNNAEAFDYAGTVVTTGLRFKKDNKYAAHIYLTKPIYENSSQLVQSALKWQGGATYTWLNKLVNITGGGDVKISDKTDFGATAGIDHIFRKELKGGLVLVADPSAYVNAGTQHFTQTSYKKSGFLFFPGVEQEVTEEVNSFNVLSYEFSVPVILGVKKLQVIAIPSYVIPQNLVKVVSRPDLSERGEPLFVFTAGLKLTL